MMTTGDLCLDGEVAAREVPFLLLLLERLLCFFVLQKEQKMLERESHMTL